MDTLFCHTSLPQGGTDHPPEWVHLIPAGAFRGADGRGPYHVENTDELIRHSMTAGKLPLDKNHSTDHAAARGGSAPAVGWITQLQPRDDGVWGHVEWNRAGTQLMSEHAYRGISPAFTAAPDGRVTRILRASLTNLPNLPLTHLHTQNSQQETTGMDLADISRRLGLPADASETDVNAALDRARDAVSLHTQVTALLKLPGTANADAVITGLRARTETVETHAQQQITQLKAQVETLRKSEAEGWIADVMGRKVVTDELKPRLVQLHTSDPETAEAIVNGLADVPNAGALLHVQSGARTPSSTPGVDPALAAKMDEAFGIKKKAS